MSPDRGARVPRKTADSAKGRIDPDERRTVERCIGGQSTLVNHSIGLINNAMDGAQQTHLAWLRGGIYREPTLGFLFLSAASRYRCITYRYTIVTIEITWPDLPRAHVNYHVHEILTPCLSKTWLRPKGIARLHIRVLLQCYVGNCTTELWLEKTQTWIRVYSSVWSLLIPRAFCFILRICTGDDVYVTRVKLQRNDTLLSLTFLWKNLNLTFSLFQFYLIFLFCCLEIS